MKVPEEIDLYDWYDYSFYRAVFGAPIPSPRVWDNAGKFGFIGGRYMKDLFFAPDFFEPSLYTKEELTNYIKEQYGNNLRLEKGKGKLMKSDKSNHKFVRTSSNNHLYLNFENFKKLKLTSEKDNYQEIYAAIGEIYKLAKSKNSQIDMGFQAPSDLVGYYKAQNKNEEKWIKLNKNLEKEFNSGINPIESLYENIYKLFDYPSKKLWELNEILNNDFWFIDMFIFSFKPKTIKWLKGFSLEKKDFEKEPNLNQIFNRTKENENNQIKQDNEKGFDGSIFKESNSLEKKLGGKEEIIFGNSRKGKGKSSIPWLPFITIPLILIVPRYISSFRSQPSPSIPQRVSPSTPSNPPLDICQLCRITNSCDTLPQCTRKQRTCEYEETWDGKIVERCRDF